MKFRKIIQLAALVLTTLAACTDDDKFTQSPSNRLTFSTDSVKLDTVFSNVPSARRDFWVYNRSGDGIRCTNIRLERGNQSGFRVNVDGTYLGASVGYQTNQVEVRNKDSIRVFVEVTTPTQNADVPKLVEDNLLFTLESGVVQKVNLNAYSWDALLLRDVRIRRDSVLTAGITPIIIYGGITVEEGATLTIPAGTTLYFHADAGIDVFGRLEIVGNTDSEVTLRGDRIDRMFDYLPYDGVSGQWKGIRFRESSYENWIQFADIHGTFDGVVCDSSDISRTKLTLHSSTVHNCQGYGLRSVNSRICLINSQITNTLGDCLCVDGGWAEVNACTLAQFYPFDANRGVALRFLAKNHALERFFCENSLVTGYSEVEMMGEQGRDEAVFNYAFSHCIIRDTTNINYVDTVNIFKKVVFENDEDTSLVYGKKHFVKVDADLLRYDFRLDSLSTAISRANPSTSPDNDRNGRRRKEKPDIGAYEFFKE